MAIGLPIEKCLIGKKGLDGTRISAVSDLGTVVQAARKEQSLTQVDIAGLAGTGNRFIVDLEKGKPTIRMQLALDVLELPGLELMVRKKGSQ